MGKNLKSIVMNRLRLKNITSEIGWLVGIFVLAVSVEYAFFELININPIISVKVQGLIGLLFIGYSLRAAYRVWELFQWNSSPKNNGLSKTEMDPE